MIMEKKKFTKRKRISGFDILFSSSGFIVLVILAQILLLFSIYNYFMQYALYFASALYLLSIITALVILNSTDTPEFKTMWLIIVIVLPGLGALSYFVISNDKTNKALQKEFLKGVEQSNSFIKLDEEVLEDCQNDVELNHLKNMMASYGVNGIYKNTKVTYLPSGEAGFERMLEKLQEAKYFIFLEYFIISEGKMWDKILEILKEKIKQGVEVKIMYDGTCDFKHLKRDYFQKLTNMGINCVKFSTIYPIITTSYDYRDHRKIMIIDGKTAFVSGFNLADEYINEISPYGYWKDTGLMLEGGAVKSLSLMFIQMFRDRTGKKDFSPLYFNQETYFLEDGYVIPYDDIPFDNKSVGEDVYVDLINKSEKYLYIMTPYFITDHKMISSIKQAAIKGVEVRLYLPGIPDKRFVNFLAKSRYKELIESGVKIYELTDGFIHGKQIVSDGIRATVGTINFDYRSLYHHFEVGVYLYKCNAINDIVDDFINLEKDCKKIEKTDLKKRWNISFILNIIRIFEPLL